MERSGVLLDLYRRPAFPWWGYLAIILGPLVVYGWIVFVLPRPYALLLGAGLVLWSLLVLGFLLVLARRSVAMAQSGVRLSMRTIPWNDVLAYRLTADGWLELTVVARTLNMVDDVVAIPCRAELHQQVEEVIAHFAPHAKRLPS